MIVKTEPYTKEQVAKVLQLRAQIEGLKLAEGVLDKLASEGERSSLRCVSLYRVSISVYTKFHAGTHFSCLHLPLFLPLSMIVPRSPWKTSGK